MFNFTISMKSFSNHFLISMPHMNDPVFAKTLIYMCEHNSEGSMGVIINKPMVFNNATDVLKQTGLRNIKPAPKIYFGGPETYGRILLFLGSGGLLGTLILTFIGKRLSNFQALIVATILVGTSLIVFSFIYTEIEEESTVPTKNEDEIPKEIVNKPDPTKKTPEIPPETPKDIEPIQEYLEETETLTEDLARSMRKVAFLSFIQGKIAVSYADKEKMLIKCVDTHTEYWLNESYKGLVEKIAGKRCEFVRG